MSLLNTLRFIATHPMNRGRRLRGLDRYVAWQLGSRLAPGDIAVPWVNETLFVARRGMRGITGNIYCGLHEFEDMSLVLHLLRSTDLFVDVGANVGSYTVLASSAVGSEVISIEPIPSTYARLLLNIHVNNAGSRVEALNIGVGDSKGRLRFTADSDTTNHVIAQGESTSDLIDVQVTTLDDVVGEREPALIKIDVEGFETPVLKGSEKTLGKNSLLGVVMELDGQGDRYGFDERELHRTLVRLGFEPFGYSPFTRELTPVGERKSPRLSGNTFYLRHLERVADRLKTADPYEVHGLRV